MENTNITVTMPIEEYNKLKHAEKVRDEWVKMFERANPDGESAIMTAELEQTIKDIYC